MTDHAMIEVRIEDVERMRARIAELEGEIERLTAERNALRDHLADEVTRLNIRIAELEGDARKYADIHAAAWDDRVRLRAENERLLEGAREAAQWLETRPDYTEGDAAVSSMLRALLSAAGESTP